MKLLWIHYKGKKRTRYILFLDLGTKDGKIVGLDTKLVDDRSRNMIMSNSTLPDMSLDSKLRWIKRFCPTAVPALRSLIQKNVVSAQEYKTPFSK